jgi:SAM-dependent methyltransferase
MLEPPEVIREDFNRIAALSDETWSHNSRYHPFLLRQLPSRLRDVLDIGCGKGDFSRLLAGRSERVTAVDLSPEMIREAQERSAQFSNIDFQTADILEWSWPQAKYDCIASIAVLHHLPPEEMLRRCAAALAPGGTLIVLDLYQAAGLVDYFLGALAVPVAAAQRIAHTGRLQNPRPVREAWDRHGRHEHYPTLPKIRGVCAKVLPGAKIRRHLLWRYSLVWRKAGG